MLPLAIYATRSHKDMGRLRFLAFRGLAGESKSESEATMALNERILTSDEAFNHVGPIKAAYIQGEVARITA